MQVVIYTREGCGFCMRAKKLLDKYQVQYKEIDAPSGSAVREKLEQETSSVTVPQIFVDNVHIGDCQRLHELEASGEFNEIFGLNR